LVIWAPGGRAKLVPEGAAEDGKGIWVVEGRNFTAENIEFTGARVPDRNGAGVRIHAKGKVTLRNCYFHDNENGVLGDADEILIDRCVFDRNGGPDGQSHNIYVWGPSVTIRNSTIQRSIQGHNIKTRGETNYILSNRILDREDGTGSYGIDVPDCGRTYIIGNVIEQGPESPNYHLISYGAESGKNRAELYLVNNTLVNDGRADGFFLKIRRGTQASIVNHIFYGPGTPWVGGEVFEGRNYIEPSLNNSPRFANPRAYDYRLTAESPRAIVDRGSPPGVSLSGYELRPKLEFLEGSERTRPTAGPLDLGAFEYPGAKVSAAAPEPKPKTYPARTTKKAKTVKRSTNQR